MVYIHFSARYLFTLNNYYFCFKKWCQTLFFLGGLPDGCSEKPLQRSYIAYYHFYD